MGGDGGYAKHEDARICVEKAGEEAADTYFALFWLCPQTGNCSHTHAYFLRSLAFRSTKTSHKRRPKLAGQCFRSSDCETLTEFPYTCSWAFILSIILSVRVPVNALFTNFSATRHQ